MHGRSQFKIILNNDAIKSFLQGLCNATVVSSTKSGNGKSKFIKDQTKEE
jgi:hypothetical protein